MVLQNTIVWPVACLSLGMLSLPLVGGRALLGLGLLWLYGQVVLVRLNRNIQAREKRHAGL